MSSQVCSRRKTRTDARRCVLAVLKLSLQERIRYPNIMSLISDPDEQIENLSLEIERAAYQSSLPVEADISSIKYHGKRINDIKMSSAETRDEIKTFGVYLSVIARFIVHISPAFYIGRHSFVFRDMLFGGTFDPKKLDEQEFVFDTWPEIFLNRYIDEKQYRQIMMRREMEVKIAYEGLLDLINSCCMDNKCTIGETEETLKNSRIFEEGSAFSKAQQKVCFAQSSGCWYPKSGEIIIPCTGETGICQRLPDNRKVGENDSAFGFCMDYEEFLDFFSIGGLNSFVVSPVEDVYLAEDVTDTIRKTYEKELKMRILYNDWMAKSTQDFIIDEVEPFKKV